MTDLIGRSARAVAAPGTRVDAVQPTMGPASIESHYDEALAVPGLLEQIALGEAEGVDAYVVACFGDPGLDAARELARGPVIGIAEAAMHAAALLGAPVQRRHHAGPHDRPRPRARPPLRVRRRVRRRCARARSRCWSSRTPAARGRLIGGVPPRGAAGRRRRRRARLRGHGRPLRARSPTRSACRSSTAWRPPRCSRSRSSRSACAPAPGEYAPPPAKPMAGLLAGFEIRTDATAPVAVA